MATDGITWRAHALVEKYGPDATAWVQDRTGLVRPEAADFARLGVEPDEVTEQPDNLLVTTGLTRVASLIVGSGQALTNTATRLGVGDGAGTAVVGDTDLSASAGSTHRWFNIMDATFPSASAAVVTAKATFASADGNFVWNEWGLDVGTPTVASGNTVATLVNHKTSAALGTKASGATWAFTVTLTLS